MKKLGRPTKFPKAWLDLCNNYGGIDLLAGALGVTRSSVQLWALRGKQPNGSARILIGQFCQSAGLPSPLISETSSDSETDVPLSIIDG
jgi:hypothetical protein